LHVGLLAAFFAAEEGLDFVISKNEPIAGGLVGKVFVSVHFQNPMPNHTLTPNCYS
jgi:hypothetical protein